MEGGGYSSGGRRNESIGEIHPLGGGGRRSSIVVCRANVSLADWLTMFTATAATAAVAATVTAIKRLTTWTCGKGGLGFILSTYEFEFEFNLNFNSSLNRNLRM